MLRKMIEQPLIHKTAIQDRLDAVEMLKDNLMAREELREYMNSIYDLERLTMKVSYRSANPRDLISFKTSIQYLPYIKDILAQFSKGVLAKMAGDLDTLEDLHELLEASIEEDPPIPIKEGGIIKEGFDEEIDHLKKAKTDGKTWLAELEEREREKTGIKNLRVRYNKVFGYYFEVSHSKSEQVPDYFIRKQTLANAERYITPELKEFEIKILSAKDKIIALEHELYQQLRNDIKLVIKDVQETARALADLDVLCSLALVAYEENYICPTIVMNGQINIRDGRHPVIEKFLKREVFVPNDIVLNHDDEEFLLITGPNMAGKSTYMRQAAILMIMAQIGSFIPAREASISPVDRIFTRVGASDDISTGQSTFMVEMKEVAYILENATHNSLIILDEIGRGTSTFDGLSIAQAVVEHICKHIHSKTLFATHYHELICLEESYSKLKNYTVAVKEKGKDVAFLRRIIKGGADRSYGIHVARLAGLPNSVLKRAEVILESLEDQSHDASDLNNRVMGAQLTNVAKPAVKQVSDSPLGNLFSHSVVDSLLEVDVMSMTPIEALNKLYELQEEARKGGGK